MLSSWNKDIIIIIIIIIGLNTKHADCRIIFTLYPLHL